MQLTQGLSAWGQSLELILGTVKSHLNRECGKRIPLPVMERMGFRGMRGSCRTVPRRDRRSLNQSWVAMMKRERQI